MSTSLTSRNFFQRAGVLLAAGALVLTGCSADGDQAEPAADDPAASAPAEDTNQEGAQEGGARSPVDDEASQTGGAAVANDDAMAAMDTAAGAVDGGIVYKVDADDENGEPVWDIKVVAGEQKNEVTVTKEGAEILKQETDDADAEDTQRAEQATVDARTALQTAADANDGKVLDEMELDEENGTLVWDIKLGEGGDEVELKVDAESGDIIS